MLELTYYNSPQELISAIADFQHQINTIPFAIGDRLWVRDPAVKRRG